jgi:hypothetical protein
LAAGKVLGSLSVRWAVASPALRGTSLPTLIPPLGTLEENVRMSVSVTYALWPLKNPNKLP